MSQPSPTPGESPRGAADGRDTGLPWSVNRPAQGTDAVAGAAQAGLDHPAPAAPDSARVVRNLQAGVQADADGSSERVRRGLPGAQVVTVGTLVVAVAAIAEVLTTDTIGRWTGITLIVVSVVASLVTRAGDRSLPAMMPPLAFLVAALVAGQALVSPGPGPIWARESLMLLDVLGSNAQWVVVATVLSVVICGTRHIIDRARDRARGRRSTTPVTNSA